MPWLSEDAWEKKAFEHVPVAVPVPLNDMFAWPLYPKHRWVYNKAQLYEHLDIPYGLAGVEPPNYPVAVKPMANIWGLGQGYRKWDGGVVDCPRPGDLWMLFHEGPHHSYDVALLNGRPIWSVLTVGHKRADTNKFEGWQVEPERGSLRLFDSMLRELLPQYTGFVNLEYIGDHLIEIALRLSAEWALLYGPKFPESVALLYEGRGWPDPGPIPGGIAYPRYNSDPPRTWPDNAIILDTGGYGGRKQLVLVPKEE